MNVFGASTDTGGVQYWNEPERAGWLQKQGVAESGRAGDALRGRVCSGLGARCVALA